MSMFEEYVSADTVLKKSCIVAQCLYGEKLPEDSYFTESEAEEKPAEFKAFAKGHSYTMLRAAVQLEDNSCLARMIASGLVTKAQCYRLLETEQVSDYHARLMLLMPEHASEFVNRCSAAYANDAPDKGEKASIGDSIGNGHFGLLAGSRAERAWLREQGQYDFSGYLKKFGTVREELVLDTESYDNIYYTLGLSRYGRMPLIEPLEYMECSKLQEMVIAIDSSYSCSENLVLKFLGEIRRIITTKENFFRRMNVVIIQCDSMIQKVDRITSIEDFLRYERELAIVGRGGTDFGPVFELVKKLKQDGTLKDLKNLLYFTDGNGIYPKEPTEYETAFVFPDKRFLEYGVPAWIVTLCLSDGELQTIDEKGR